MADLGRVGEALEWAWAEYCAHPDRFSFDRLMAFVPAAASPAWREKAVVAALDTGGLRPLVELLVHTGETERLADLIGQSPYSAVQGLSHYMAEPAGRSLEPGHPLAAARTWRAQGMRILAGRKSPQYEAAVDYFGRAERCYAWADRIGEWRETVAQVHTEHGRKGRFMPRFQTLVQDADTERHPSFLERARSRWALPDPDQS